MSEYLEEKISALIKTGEVYSGLRDFNHANKSFESAISILETEATVYDPLMKRVLVSYALCLRKQKQDTRASELEKQAENIFVKPEPIYFNKDGSYTEEAKESVQLQSIPKLPFEFHATRALGPDRVLQYLVGSIFVALPLSLVVDAVHLDFLVPFVFLAIPVATFMLTKRYYARISENGKTCRCRVTEDGLEFRDVDGNYRIRWNEIENVSRRDEFLTRDKPYDAITVYGGGKKFKISSFYFTEVEVLTIAKAVKLLSPAASKNDSFLPI